MEKARFIYFVADNGVRFLDYFDVRLRDLPKILTASPGPGKGWRQTISFGHPQFLAEFPDLILEQDAQGLNQFHLELFRQAADVMMALDHGRGPPNEDWLSMTSGYSVPWARYFISRVSWPPLQIPE